MQDLIQFTEQLKKISPNTIEESILEQLIIKINKFELEHADAIKEQDHLIENIEKKKYLKNPKFKLYEQGNQGVSRTLVAKVKFPFHFKGERKKPRNINVFLGTTKRYPGGVDDKQLAKDAPKIIRDYFATTSPDFQVDNKLIESMEKKLKVFRYWKEKANELDLRFNPVFTVASSTNANNVRIYVANVKWGYPTTKNITPKKYLSCYLGVAKYYGDNPKKEDFVDKVKEFIRDKAPLVIDPPI